MSQMKPYCFKCGAELDPDTIYCPVCGRLQRSMVVRNVEAGGTGVAPARGEGRYQGADPARADEPGFADQEYQAPAEQPYDPAVEQDYDQAAGEQHYQQHDQHYASGYEASGYAPHYQTEQGYPDDQPPGGQEGHGYYGAEDQGYYQPTQDAYGQPSEPGYGPDQYPTQPEAYPDAYGQGYAAEPPGDYQSYAGEAAEEPANGGYVPQPPQGPSYPRQEDHPTWQAQAPTEPPPPPPPPPPRFVPYSGQAATGTRTSPPSPARGTVQPPYASAAGGQHPTPGAGPSGPGGPGAPDLPGGFSYPGYQPAAPPQPSWTRRFALGVAGLLVLFLVGLGIGHVFGSPSSTPAGTQSSRFTQLPSQAPTQPPATAPAQVQPSPTIPSTPFPSTAPTITGSASWHTVSAQILNGGKCSISRGCEAGGTFRNSGGPGNGVVTFNITDRGYQTVYASCTAPLPQTDGGETATVSCWANSDQLDQLFESDPNAYIYLQVQLGTG